MLLITCPYCGPRPEEEFINGREAHIARPSDSDTMTDEEWARFTFIHNNEKGWMRERWMHAAGCRRWFNAVRHNVTSEWHTAYPMFSALPDLPSDPSSLTAPSDSPAAKVEV